MSEAICIITYFDEDEGCVMVSHGVGVASLRTYQLPPERWHPGMWGSRFDEGMGEWVIE